MKIKDLAYTALMSVVIVVCSWVSIYLFVSVPFTMQTFGIFCTLLLLGGKRGFFAILLYVFMGMAGLPVFSGWRSGIAALMGPTGGYIAGFILCGAFYWAFEKRGRPWCLLALGNVLCYLFGTLWFVFVYAAGGKAVSFGAALLTCVVPYILPDAVKLVLALVVSARIKPALKL